MKKALLATAFALLALPAAAGDDFGLWTEAAVQKEFAKHFALDAGIEFRLDDNATRASRWAFSVGGSYKPCKYLGFSTGYVFIHSYSPQEAAVDYKKDGTTFNGYNIDHGYWRNKHRYTFDVTGKLPLGSFTLSVRERYQYTHYVATSTLRDRYRDLLLGMYQQNPSLYTGEKYLYGGKYYQEYSRAEKDKKAKNKHYLRSRFELEYNIRHCAWTPYVAFEFCNNLGDAWHLDKTRLTAGAEWKITKKHRLNVAYVYDNGADDDDGVDTHAVSIGYKFKF